MPLRRSCDAGTMDYNLNQVHSAQRARERYEHASSRLLALRSFDRIDRALVEALGVVHISLDTFVLVGVLPIATDYPGYVPCSSGTVGCISSQPESTGRCLTMVDPVLPHDGFAVLIAKPSQPLSSHFQLARLPKPGLEIWWS
jgi:hypothetical protein